MHSWRVRSCRYLEQQPFYDRYDFREPWNGPKNGQLGDDIPDTWYDKRWHAISGCAVSVLVSLPRCAEGTEPHGAPTT